MLNALIKPPQPRGAAVAPVVWSGKWHAMCPGPRAGTGHLCANEPFVSHTNLEWNGARHTGVEQ